jgi:membrane protease YdiL (CAAX protease family)
MDDLPVPPTPPRPDRWVGPLETPTAPSELALARHPAGPAPPWSRLRERMAATWSVWWAVGLFLVGDLLIGQLLLGGALVVAMGVHTLSTGAAGTPELVVTVAADLGFLATMAVWIRQRVKDWRAIFGVPTRERMLREAVVGALCGPAIYLGVSLLAAFLLTPVIGLFTKQQVQSAQQISSHLSGGGTALLIVLSLVVAPVTEETFFRGVLYRSVRDRRGFVVGAIVSSLLFGLSHYVGGPWPDTVLLQVTMVGTGIGLASLYEWRGNLLANIAAHMAFNTLGVILILAQR